MREEVYETLLKWIMEGVLQPGEKLLDKDLADRLGVSRTPVREALRRLEDKGLVESSANRWTRVARIAITEPQKFYPIICTLEELALAQVIDRLDEKDFKEMIALNRMLKKAVQEQNAVQASWADVEFHRLYIEKTENDHLIRILDDLKITFRRVEITYFGGCSCATESVEEHQAILDALQNGDLASAQQAVRNNWQNSLDRLQAAETE